MKRKQIADTKTQGDDIDKLELNDSGIKIDPIAKTLLARLPVPKQKGHNKNQQQVNSLSAAIKDQSVKIVTQNNSKTTEKPSVKGDENQDQEEVNA